MEKELLQGKSQERCVAVAEPQDNQSCRSKGKEKARAKTKAKTKMDEQSRSDRRVWWPRGCFGKSHLLLLPLPSNLHIYCTSQHKLHAGHQPVQCAITIYIAPPTNPPLFITITQTSTLDPQPEVCFSHQGHVYLGIKLWWPISSFSSKAITI